MCLAAFGQCILGKDHTVPFVRNLDGLHETAWYDTGEEMVIKWIVSTIDTHRTDSDLAMVPSPRQGIPSNV
jgi:hypothetical protein